MENRIRFQTIIYLTVIFLSCNCGPKTQSTPCQKIPGHRPKLNITVFLDLSNRISPTINPKPEMECWKRDLGYIESITKAFECHLMNKQMVLMDDHIKLFLHPFPPNIPNIDSGLKALNKKFTKENTTPQYIDSISEDYNTFSKLIYTKTLQQMEPLGTDNYPGSDIFDFFKSRVKDYCIRDNHRNILFILTDGYMYHSQNRVLGNDKRSSYITSAALSGWGFNVNNYKSKLANEGYAFQVPVTGLDKLEVMVIGLSPKNTWEMDVLNSFWAKWFKEMGVKNFQGTDVNKYLKKDDLPYEVENLIQDFIWN